MVAHPNLKLVDCGATFLVRLGKMTVAEFRAELQAMDAELATWGDTEEIEVQPFRGNEIFVDTIHPRWR